MTNDKRCIYTLSDDNGVRYVGQTNNPKVRLLSHLSDARYGSNQKDEWIKNLGQHNPPKMDIIEWCSRDLVNEREYYWIGYYIKSGADLLNSQIGNNSDKRPTFLLRFPDKETKGTAESLAERLGYSLTEYVNQAIESFNKSWNEQVQ